MKGTDMLVLEYVLLIVLLVSAVFIVVAVLMAKSSEDGLSGAISGRTDTFYGKDKSSHSDRALYKFTLIASIVFMLAVLAVYVIQPDFPRPDINSAAEQLYELDAWQTNSNYSYVFPTE